MKEMCRLVDEGMDAGACGWSAQVNGAGSIQRDYDGTPMITDLMTDEEPLAFGRVLGERDEGFIELSYQGEAEGRPMQEHAMTLFEKLAEISNRPILYQGVAANDNDPERYRERLRWLQECAKKGLRVYGQGSVRRGDVELTFEDFNLLDEHRAWREVTLGTPEERMAKMRNPELRAALRAEWNTAMLPENIAADEAAPLASPSWRDWWWRKSAVGISSTIWGIASGKSPNRKGST